MNSSHAQSRRATHRASLADSGELFTPDSLGPEAVVPGSYNDEFVVRQVVTQTIRDCGKTRDAIAEEMTALLGTRVTRRALDSYTSETAEQNRFPAQYTRAFCHVTGDWTLLRCVSQLAGLHVISKAEAKLMELGRQFLIEKRAAAAIARLQEELEEVALG